MILLAGTGEQGYRRRRHCVAYPLARLGIASLILESPFYGARKPPKQKASKLATLTDLPLLGRVTIEEARCLTKWLQRRQHVEHEEGHDATQDAATQRAPAPSSLHRQDGQPHIRDSETRKIAAAAVAAADSRRADPPASAVPQAAPRRAGGGGGASRRRIPDGGYGHIVLAGTSMGGLHAAMTASVVPWDVGVASWLGPASANPVFTRGRLAFGTDWRHFAKEVGSPSVAEGLEAHIRGVEEALGVTASGLSRHGTPHSSLPTPEDERALRDVCADVPPAQLALAQRQASRILRLTDITNFPCPARPDAAVFVRAAQDQYVPLDEDAESMWSHVRREWGGCEVRTVRGGHVTASLFALDTYAGTIVEVVRRLARTNTREKEEKGA